MMDEGKGARDEERTSNVQYRTQNKECKRRTEKVKMKKGLRGQDARDTDLRKKGDAGLFFYI
jgi:hypothetical protein